MRAFKGVESSFSQLSSNPRFLISFWCKEKVAGCIDDWVEFVENHVLSILYFLAYPLHMANLSMFLDEICSLDF